MLQQQRIDRCYDTLWCIVASPYVHEYMIGYTARAGRQRLGEYQRMHSYQHLVVLADRLTRADALNLERALQDAIKLDRRRYMYKKYHPERRDSRYYPSAGNATSDPLALVHSVYLAWWEDL